VRAGLKTLWGPLVCTISYLKIFEAGPSFEKSIIMAFNEASIYDFISPNTTWQRHLERSVANVWKLIQKIELNLKDI